MLFQDAFYLAQKFLDERMRPEHEVEIVLCGCTETDEGWTFAYDSREFLEEGKIRYALVGNPPVVVPSSGAPVRLAPTIPMMWASERE